MSTIEVQVTNPNDIRLRVTAEYSIGEWREILKTSEGTRYYAPLHELLAAIRAGIHSIEDRAKVSASGDAAIGGIQR